MKLHNLKPACGSTHSRRRIGRGPGSGLGGTSTRGHKGAKARSGYNKKIGLAIKELKIWAIWDFLMQSGLATGGARYLEQRDI